MALETAMRLSEMFTLTWDQVDFELRTIFLDRTKTSRTGRSGKRQIPITSVLYTEHPATTHLAATNLGGFPVDRGHGAAAQLRNTFCGEDRHGCFSIESKRSPS